MATRAKRHWALRLGKAAREKLVSPYTGLIVLVDEPRGVALGTHCRRDQAPAAVLD
jgi:hypothetical protein